jgi:hypothetical protein
MSWKFSCLRFFAWGHVVHNPVAAYNTIVMAGGQSNTPGVFQWGADGTTTPVNPLVHDNFINPTGVLYSIVSTYMQDPTGVVNPVTYNNVNMTTGKQLLSGRYENLPAFPATRRRPRLSSARPPSARPR